MSMKLSESRDSDDAISALVVSYHTFGYHQTP